MSFGPVKIKERRRTYHHVVDVDVDVSLDLLPTEDLIYELKERGELRDEAQETADFLEIVLETIRRRDYAEAELMIERQLRPKWSSLDEAMKAFKALPTHSSAQDRT